MSLDIEFLSPGLQASCETFPEQIGILGANKMKMLFEISLAYSITHYYTVEMKDSRKDPLYLTGNQSPATVPNLVPSKSQRLAAPGSERPEFELTLC